MARHRKFDIVATFAPETSGGHVRDMSRALLAERFSLKIHTESRTLTSYALIVGKGGPKLKPGIPGSDGAFIFADDHVTGRAISMAALTSRLSGPVFKLGRPMLDMTGIEGVYNSTLAWAPDDGAAEGSSNASIFTALQEQLGLKLEPGRLASSILVVGFADKISSGN